MKRIWIWVFGILIAGVIGAQSMRMSSLRAQMADLRARVEGATATADVQPSAADQRPLSFGSLPQRVANLEATVSQLSKSSDFLVERGMVPPSAGNLEQLHLKFADPNSTDADRIRAFRVLRRNGQVSDNIALQAMSWLESSTNTRTKRDLVEQMRGLTNAAVKGPLLGMLSTEPAARVREGLVEALAEFPPSADTDKKLWDLALNDPDDEVRDEAADTLTDGTQTPERLAALTQRLTNPQLSLDERLLALKGLRDGDKQPPEVISELSTLAQNSADPLVRAKLYDAFDGIKNPALMSSLVHGLQDTDPIVRERAADALGTFAADTRIQDWLKHVIQNDPDPRVQREAHQALNQAQRRRN